MSDQRLYEKWLKAKNENYDLKAEVERLRRLLSDAHSLLDAYAEQAAKDGEAEWHPEKGKTYEAF